MEAASLLYLLSWEKGFDYAILTDINKIIISLPSKNAMALLILFNLPMQ